MQKLVWQNANGVELDLTSGNYGITEWEGFSNASLNIQQQQVPFQDGGVFLDALIEQRELSVTLAIQDNNNLELRYQLRRELISALNPKLGEGCLIYTNDYISKRIKCVPQIPLFETHNSDTVGTPKASLSWTACSPYWEDLEETEVEIGAEPTEVINEGECEIGFEADILASNIDNFILQNITTGQKIEIEDNIGTEIELDTKVGEKRLIAQATNLEELTFNYIIRPKRGLVWVEELNIYVAEIEERIDEQLYYYCGISADGETWVKGEEREIGCILWNKAKGKLYAISRSSTDGLTWNIVSSTDGLTWNNVSALSSEYAGVSSSCANVYTGEMFFISDSSTYKSFRTLDGINIVEIPNVRGAFCTYNPKTNIIYTGLITTSIWICQNSGQFVSKNIYEGDYGGEVVYCCATGDNGDVVIGRGTLGQGVFVLHCNADLTEVEPWQYEGDAPLFNDIAFASGHYIISGFMPYSSVTKLLISKDGKNWIDDCYGQLDWYAVKTITGKDGVAYLCEYSKAYTSKIGEENKISKLTPDSDMSLKLTQGTNYLFYSASLNEVGTTEGVSVKLKYRQKYIGV